MRLRWTQALTALALTAGALAIFAGVSSADHGTVRHLNLPGRTDDLPFTHVVAAGDTLYVAGTLGLDPETGQPPADHRHEARLALDGVKEKLLLAGATMDELVSVQIYCSDIALYKDFNAIYRTYFEKRFPARAFIGSGPLLRGARFEVSAIAVKR